MEKIFQTITDAGGIPYFVGGFVRDQLLGTVSKDIDIEVFGLSCEQLCAVLESFGKVSLVGESFGVIKLRMEDQDFDFSLPRRENKSGRGHKGFQVRPDHTMTFPEAARRRDFTINAMGRKITGEIVDPFNGLKDLKQRILRCTSEAFAEDPLRVLRGFQFAARFQLTADSSTLEMCQSLITEAETLPRERIWNEWEKWALKGRKPSLGLKFLVESGWIRIYPELANLIYGPNNRQGIPQDPLWHPEGQDHPWGSVFVHVMHVVDAAAEIADRDGIIGEDRLVLMLAALCHDLGKAWPEQGGTTQWSNGRWKAPGHAEAGVPLAESFLARIGCLDRIRKRVIPLVQEHMICATTKGKRMTPRVVRRLSMRLGEASIKDLIPLIEADHAGRPPLPPGLPESAVILQDLSRSMNLDSANPEPLLLGRHLLALGVTPGPGMGAILKECFERQLDGIYDDTESGIQFLKSRLVQIDGKWTINLSNRSPRNGEGDSPKPILEDDTNEN